MEDLRRTRLLGALAVAGASVLWGTTGVSASFAPEMPAMAIGAAAMGGGGLLQALAAFPQIVRSASRLWSRLLFVFCSALMVALYPLAFYSSMRLAGITAGTVISIGSAPIFAALIEWAAEGVRPSPRLSAASALGAAGIAVLSFARSSGSAGPSVSAGIALGLAAGFTYAGYSWAARRLMRAGIPSRAAMGALFGTASVMLLPVLLAVGAPFLHSAVNLSVGLYMAFVPMFLGYLLFGAGLARISASEATAISLLEPTVAAFLAALIAGERLSVPAWGGIALIFACLALVVSPRGRRPPRG